MKGLVLAAALLGLGIVSAAAQQGPKAQCKMFQKTNDGRWYSTIDSKVGSPKDFKVLKAGVPIESDLVVAGMNVAATVEQLCGHK